MCLTASLSDDAALGLLRALGSADEAVDHPIGAPLWGRLPLPVTPAQAWQALPPEARNELGAGLVAMVFADFLTGQAYVVEDRFYDAEIREEAAGISEFMLNHLYKRVEAALPPLFGGDGEQPEWAVKAGLVA